MVAQWVEVGVVADTGQCRYHHPQWCILVGDVILWQCIFCIKLESMQIGEYADHRFSGTLLQPLQPRLQQLDVAAKTVDDEADHAILFTLRQQFQCADQMGENPTTIDVGHQHHWTIDRLGKTHVGDIAIP